VNTFFKLYSQIIRKHPTIVYLGRADVLRINQACNNIEIHTMLPRLTFILFFSFLSSFAISMFQYSYVDKTDEIRNAIQSILNWFPKNLMKDFAGVMLLFFSICVPGFLLIKILVWLFYRKSNSLFAKFFLSMKLRSVYFFTWVVFLLNIGPILALSFFNDPDIQLRIISLLLAVIYFEMTVVIGSLAGSCLIYFERRLPMRIESIFPDLLFLISQLRWLDLRNHSEVQKNVSRLRRLSRALTRVGSSPAGSEKFGTTAMCINLYSEWLVVPYSHTASDISTRLTVLFQNLSSGTLAELVLPEFKQMEMSKRHDPANVTGIANFLLFVAAPVIAVLLLNATGKAVVPDDTVKLLLTLFFVIWSTIGAYAFIKDALPDVFSDLMGILKTVVKN
jgi:hypothetical protein